MMKLRQITERKRVLHIVVAVLAVLLMCSCFAGAASALYDDSLTMPSWATQVDSITSTGTQYIQTSIVPTTNTKTVVDFEAENTDSINIIGTEKNNNGNKAYQATTWENSISIGLSDSSFIDLDTLSIYPYTSGRHTLVFNDGGTYKLDDTWTYTNKARSYTASSVVDEF